MALASTLQELLQSANELGVTHTLPEVLQQPRLWLDTEQRAAKRHDDFQRFWQQAGAREVVLIGAGSSDFVAQLVAPSFRTRFGVVAQALASTDLLTQASTLLLQDQHYLFVWFSRSGSTPEALELLPRLEQLFPSGHHLIITCSAQSELARQVPPPRSFVFELDDAANDRGLAMTSSLTCMTLAGVALAGERLAAAQLGRAAEKIFEQAQRLSELARGGCSSACFLGSGALKAAAGECALKLTELTAGRIKTRSDSFLGVRHGPLASLDHETLLIGLVSRSREERLYELELVREVRHKSLARTILLLTPEHDARAEELADLTLNLELPPAVPEPCRPVLDVTAGQLLALFFSLAQGIRPDSPSLNGAISRVVRSIRP